MGRRRFLRVVHPRGQHAVRLCATQRDAQDRVNRYAEIAIRDGRLAARAGPVPERGWFCAPTLAAGVDPDRMLHGNPQAMARALVKAGLTFEDMSVIEVNEAFASVVLQTVADCNLEERLDDVNPNGGGISLGHPLLAELERREARYGIASMCVGQGQAIAAVIERL